MKRLSLLVALLVGCAEVDTVEPVDGHPSGDDGGVGNEPPAEDARPADATLAPPDDPTDATCQYLPMEDFGQMPNYPVRFGTGQGLEISPDIRQVGLLELDDADISKRDVIEKRAGAVQLGDARSTTPGDVVPDDDRQALWTRGNEVVLQTRDAIYKENQAITGFTWTRAGSWIMAHLREFYANTFSVEVVSADYAVLGESVLVAYQLTGGTVVLAIYGPNMALEATQTYATSERPRLTSEGDRIRLTYRDTAANVLFTGLYTAGAAGITVASTGFGVALGLDWDVASTRLDTGNRVSIFVREDAAPNVLVNIIADSRTSSHTVVTGYTSISDVNVSIWPLEVTGDIRYIVSFSGVVAATNNAQTYTFELPIVAGAAVQISNLRTVLAAATFACAASWESVDKAWVAVEETSGTTRRVVYARGDLTVALGFTVNTVTHESTSLVSTGAIISGTPTNVTSPADLLSPGFVEQLLSGTLSQRSGWILFAPRTGEIVARSFVGFTGDLGTRSIRPEKGSLLQDGEFFMWAGPAAVPSEPSDNLRAIALCRLDTTARANKPAYLDGTAVSAHGGYPRAYDGTSAFEHDWHFLPRIRTPVAGLAGSTSAGNHFIAVTWEADDANGLRYRSAPRFEPGAVLSAGVVGASGIGATIDPMTHTERLNVRVVIWMTPVGFPQYYRAGEAAITGAIQTVIADADDVTLKLNEQLDQALVSSGLGVVPSVPARVTDFVALLIDRLASRDPRAGSVMTFTTPSREASGFAAHWYDEGRVQEALERDVTSVIEMDGRTLMGSALGFSQLQGDGPDATGVGTFGTPLVVRAPIGIADHTLTERSPLGYLFGSARGPRLLTPGLSVGDIHEPVARQYEIEGGNLVGIMYDELNEEIIWLDDTVRTLRLNTHNARWASDSNRLGRDIAKRSDGVVYLLRGDGKVLRQDPDTYWDGLLNYNMTVSFRLREPSRDGQAHGGFIFNGLEVFGEYLGLHDLNVRVTIDFRDGTTVFQGTKPASELAANAAEGRDYRYALYTPGIHCYAARCEIILDGEDATARLDGIDVRYNSDSSSDPAQLPEEQRIPLDTSAV